MNVQHLNVKFFFENPDAINLEDFIAIFNGWIQERSTEELLVDVADYRHVFNGPAILLVGHQANYSIDNSDGRSGLLYSRKAQVSGLIEERLAQSVRAALKACRRLETEQGLKFSGREVKLIVNDRLLAPNTPETVADLEPELKRFFERLYGGTKFRLEQNTDPCERFTVSAVAATPFDIETLFANLIVESEAAHA